MVLVRKLKKLLIILIALWLLTVVLFSFLPVPFSAVMAQRQISAWSEFDFSYVSHSTWVSEKEIAPVMYLAVIASEDQNFPKHWGFDFDAIEKVFKKIITMVKHYVEHRLFLSKRSKIFFYGMVVVGLEKVSRPE